MPKKTDLFGTEDRILSGTFLTFYISVLMCRERKWSKLVAKDSRCGKQYMLPLSKARCIYTYRLFIM